MSRAFGFATALAVIFAIAVAFSCFFTVNQTEQALVLQFGAPVAVVREPGLHTKLPWQGVNYFDRRLLKL